MAGPTPATAPGSVRIAVEPSPTRRRTGLWLGLLGVVAVGAVATVAVVASSDDDDTVAVATTTTIDGAGALDAWQAIVDEVDFDAGGYGSGGEMASCPFGDLDEWTANAPESVADVVDVVTGEDEYLEVFETVLESDQQFLVQCLYYDERSETQVGIAITKRLDMDYRQELAEILVDFDVVYDPDRAYAGGTLVSYCANADPESAQLTFCEAGWYDDDVLINVFYTDEEARSDDAATWLQASLPDWLQDLEGADLGDVDVTTVTY